MRRRVERSTTAELPCQDEIFDEFCGAAGGRARGSRLLVAREAAGVRELMRAYVVGVGGGTDVECRLPGFQRTSTKLDVPSSVLQAEAWSQLPIAHCMRARRPHYRPWTRWEGWLLSEPWQLGDSCTC